MAQASRTPLQQTFFNFTIAVKTSPTPISQLLDISSMIQTFELGNPSVNTNSIFYGDSGVTASSAGSIGTGIELTTGTSKTFRIVQERQFYEIQNPVLVSAAKDACQTIPIDMIPLIVWKLNDFWLIATVNTTISCLCYRSVFI